MNDKMTDIETWTKESNFEQIKSDSSISYESSIDNSSSEEDILYKEEDNLIALNDFYTIGNKRITLRECLLDPATCRCKVCFPRQHLITEEIRLLNPQAFVGLPFLYQLKHDNEKMIKFNIVKNNLSFTRDEFKVQLYDFYNTQVYSQDYFGNRKLGWLNIKLWDKNGNAEYPTKLVFDLDLKECDIAIRDRLCDKVCQLIYSFLVDECGVNKSLKIHCVFNKNGNGIHIYADVFIWEFARYDNKFVSCGDLITRSGFTYRELHNLIVYIIRKALCEDFPKINPVIINKIIDELPSGTIRSVLCPKFVVDQQKLDTSSVYNQVSLYDTTSKSISSHRTQIVDDWHSLLRWDPRCAFSTYIMHGMKTRDLPWNKDELTLSQLPDKILRLCIDIRKQRVESLSFRYNNGNDNKIKDIVITYDTLAQICKNIPIEYLDSSKHWRVMCSQFKYIALQNPNDSKKVYDLFDEVSSKSTEYNSVRNKQIWDTCKPLNPKSLLRFINIKYVDKIPALFNKQSLDCPTMLNMNLKYLDHTVFKPTSSDICNLTKCDFLVVNKDSVNNGIDGLRIRIIDGGAYQINEDGSVGTDNIIDKLNRQQICRCDNKNYYANILDGFIYVRDNITGKSYPVAFHNDPDMKSTILIKSNLGTGKTTGLIDYLKRNPQLSYVYVSIRRLLSLNICKRFEEAGLEPLLYLRAENNRQIRESRQLIIQVDSLNKLLDMDDMSFAIPNFDIVILDESELIITQLESHQIKNVMYKLNNYTVMASLMCGSPQVIMMDAFMGTNSYNFAKAHRDNIVYLENQYVDTNKNIIVYDEPIIFQNTMLGMLGDNKQIALISNNKHALQRMIELIDREAQQHEKLKDEDDENYVSFNNKNIIITSDESQALYRDDEFDNNLKKGYNLIYSPTLTAGVDITHPIENIFMLVEKTSCNIKCLLQMIGRIRNHTNLHILFRQVGSKKGIEYNQVTFEVIKNNLIGSLARRDPNLITLPIVCKGSNRLLHNVTLSCCKFILLRDLVEHGYKIISKNNPEAVTIIPQDWTEIDREILLGERLLIADATKIDATEYKDTIDQMKYVNVGVEAIAGVRKFSICDFYGIENLDVSPTILKDIDGKDATIDELKDARASYVAYLDKKDTKQARKFINLRCVVAHIDSVRNRQLRISDFVNFLERRHANKSRDYLCDFGDERYDCFKLDDIYYKKLALVTRFLSEIFDVELFSELDDVVVMTQGKIERVMELYVELGASIKSLFDVKMIPLLTSLPDILLNNKMQRINTLLLNTLGVKLVKCGKDSSYKFVYPECVLYKVAPNKTGKLCKLTTSMNIPSNVDFAHICTRYEYLNLFAKEYGVTTPDLDILEDSMDDGVMLSNHAHIN